MIGNNDLGALITLTAQSTGTVDSGPQTNQQARGIKIVVDVTAISGTGAQVIVTLEGIDAASGKKYSILASAALSAVATTVLTVYPGATASANVAANDHLPLNWHIKAVVSGTTPSVTGTIAACLLD